MAYQLGMLGEPAYCVRPQLRQQDEGGGNCSPIEGERQQVACTPVEAQVAKLLPPAVVEPEVTLQQHCHYQIHQVECRLQNMTSAVRQCHSGLQSCSTRLGPQMDIPNFTMPAMQFSVSALLHPHLCSLELYGGIAVQIVIHRNMERVIVNHRYLNGKGVAMR